MQQVLFHLPVLGWPIYGYGMMLFLAFFFCTWLCSWLAKKEGIPTQSMQDMALWIFIWGIIGARLVFMVQYRVPFADIYKIWDGGLVFYGSGIGGVVGYLGAYYFVLRKQHISSWQMADVLAPCVALGLCLGRFGCLLNGCCYGNVACTDCPAVHFPLPTFPRFELVRKGFQTAAGFTMSEDFGKDNDRRVAKVEPGSPAAAAGLRDDDVILEIDGNSKAEVYSYLGDQHVWPRGKNALTLKVRHRDGTMADLEPFVPRTIGLHPTQLYESTSTLLIFFLLLAYFPYRPRDGAAMALLMLCYAVHRFLNEILRDDTAPVFAGMTLSQNISIVLFAGGVALTVILWFRPPRAADAQPGAARNVWRPQPT